MFDAVNDYETFFTCSDSFRIPLARQTIKLMLLNLCNICVYILSCIFLFHNRLQHQKSIKRFFSRLKTPFEYLIRFNCVSHAIVQRIPQGKLESSLRRN